VLGGLVFRAAARAHLRIFSPAEVEGEDALTAEYTRDVMRQPQRWGRSADTSLHKFHTK